MRSGPTWTSFRSRSSGLPSVADRKCFSYVFRLPSSWNPHVTPGTRLGHSSHNPFKLKGHSGDVHKNSLLQKLCSHKGYRTKVCDSYQGQSVHLRQWSLLTLEWKEEDQEEVRVHRGHPNCEWGRTEEAKMITNRRNPVCDLFRSFFVDAVIRRI